MQGRGLHAARRVIVRARTALSAHIRKHRVAAPAMARRCLQVRAAVADAARRHVASGGHVGDFAVGRGGTAQVEVRVATRVVDADARNRWLRA